MTYLLPKQEYIDRHDRATVHDCRWRVEFHNNFKPNKPEGAPDGWTEAVKEIILYYDLFFTTLRRWEDKEKTVAEWMQRDEKRDHLFDTANPPEGIRCLKCWTPLKVEDKSLHDWDDKGDRVLFFLACPAGCIPYRAFFDNGEEYKVRRPVCPACKTDLQTTHSREGKKITTIDTCTKCGYTNNDVYELGTYEEKPDPDFEKDRARFCLSDDDGRKAREERLNMEQLGKLVDGWKEKDKHKVDYDAVKQLQKLTFLDLEKLLLPLMEAQGYTRLQFGAPDMGKDLVVGFTVYDSKPERVERNSSHTLTRLLKKGLSGTNWRLMSDGVNYRLGVLTGRLRAYEREEDLLELVRQASKKTAQKEN